MSIVWSLVRLRAVFGLDSEGLGLGLDLDLPILYCTIKKPLTHSVACKHIAEQSPGFSSGGDLRRFLL